MKAQEGKIHVRTSKMVEIRTNVVPSSEKAKRMGRKSKENKANSKVGTTKIEVAKGKPETIIVADGATVKKNNSKEGLKVGVDPNKKVEEFYIDLPPISDDDFVTQTFYGSRNLKPKGDTISVFYKYSGEKIRSRICRSSFYKYMTQMSNEQKKVVKEIGFGDVLDIKISGIPTRLGKWLVKNYNHKTSVLDYVGSKRTGEAKVS